jgi:hypothetical protein
MLFRTEIQLAESKQKIQAEDRIFSIGSCFATEMASIFASGQLQTVNNPFGTIFHPVAVNNALKGFMKAENIPKRISFTIRKIHQPGSSYEF